jgi:hypothetical protein
MVYVYAMTTYEAGRDATERQPSAGLALLLQIPLQIAGSG